MKKRLKIKLKKESGRLYKGIYISKNSPYSFGGFKVVAFFPDIEGYFKNHNDAKKYIDSNIAKIKTELDSNIPF